MASPNIYLSTPPQRGLLSRLAFAKRKLLWLLIPALAVVAFVVQGQSTLPDPVNLSTIPLYSSGTRDKPTLSLALSVEFPTVGAQYLDGTYGPANEYLGYFDSESCYTYNNNASTDLRRFDRSGAATNRTCGGTGFSGNFMNWASSSAIDVLRLGLTGGDRIVDTASLTVLQRAVLPTNFWNTGNFPSKQLPAAVAAGAVPDNLRTNYTGTIFVANCLNRIHFGSEATGNCGTPANNSNLGTPRPSGLWADFANCAGENATCTPATNFARNESRSYEVAYGADIRFNFQTIVLTRGNNNNSVQPSFTCNNTTFGDPANGTVKNCYVRLSSSTNPQFQQNTTQYGGPVLTADNFFYSRVQVCDMNSSGVLQDPRAPDLTDKPRSLCFKYPNNSYKPVGQLQKNSDNLRVAAFGYLKQNDNVRYGGVLRAPMKYVGGKTYDSTGGLVNGTNPKREWDENTGVFIANPEGATEGISGVINYTNQFGRTGATPGVYKTYDPVGELYYEALRYVQGLSPTPAAVSLLTTDNRDGYPVYGTSTDPWVDPHAGGSSAQNYSCVRNNIFVIGDVNTHNDKSIPGNTTRLTTSEFSRAASLAANEPDFVQWTKVVGGFESNHQPPVSYLDGKGLSRDTSNPNTVVNTARWGMENEAIGADNASYYIAGMAYWANTHDIRGATWTDQPTKQRPGMRVTTYMLDVNENGSQNNVNTRRFANQFFFAAKYGGFDDKSEIGNPYLNKNGTLDNSNWQRQSDPGEAENYFLSSNARAVLSSLSDIFESIAKKGNSIAGGAISSKQVATSGAIYQAQFDPAAWNGDLTATGLSVDSATNAVTLGSTNLWSAATQLNSKDITARNIVVGRAAPTTTDTATPFLWGSIESTLTDSLNKPNPTTASDARGQARLNYLRGDRTLETTTTGPTLRRRASRLGDIINSGVIYSGEPTTAINAAGYLDFYNANKTRTAALFVGANDGMLHAFNAANGDELFGYIPSWMGPKLSALSNDSYITDHQSYVDSTPVVAEAQLGTDWKTVLVGGTGAGGQGVFALDVTNPTAFDSSKVMWEFTDRNDPKMGNVIGDPQIRRFRTSAPGVAPATYKWYAIVASGVNNYVSDGSSTTSTTSNPAIFLLDLSKAKNASWAEGTNYFKIVMPVDSTLGSRATGIANFDTTVNSAGDIAYLYAGDLHGRMWKLDFSKVAITTANMTINNLSTFYTGAATSPTAVPMYIARDASGVPQPITTAPVLISAPARTSMVAFGTGKYLESSDNTVTSTTQVQSFYALYDDNTATLDATASPTAAISGRGRLAAGTVSSGTVSFSPFKLGRPLSDTDLSKRSGWYFNFGSGERVINTGDTIGANLVFGSVIPPSNATQVCGTGSGNLYNVNVLSGVGTSLASDVGLLGPPVTFDVGNAQITPSDSVGRRTKTIKTQQILQGSSGVSLSAGQVERKVNLGRLNWRQINNYQELRNAP